MNGFMKFRFNIDKSIASTAYLIEKNKGAYNVIFVVKALYYANRQSLVRFGRSITGDRLVSMKSGPNVSETYDLIGNSAEHAKPEHLQKWNQFFVRKHNTMTKIAEPSLGCLSKSEIDLLDEAYAVVGSVQGRLDEWSHKFFPEWKKPAGLSQSITIDPKVILLIEKKTSDEIKEIEEETDSVNWLNAIAG
jgi:hypothetical protein